MVVVQTRINQYYYNSESNEIMQRVVNNMQGAVLKSIRLQSVSRGLQRFDTLILNITDVCNLRCRYCCYSGAYRNTRSHGRRTLSYEQIDTALGFLAENKKSDTVLIGFYGGECFLHFDKIRYAIEKAEVLFGESVSFFTTTNGTLLTQDVVSWLFQHSILVNISLDGTGAHNDCNRVDSSGKGSFDIIHKNLAFIKEHYPEKWESSINFMMTLPERDQLIPIAEDWNKDPVLKDKSPVQISALAPNYEKGVSLINEEESKAFLLKVLDVYEQHPEYAVLKAYLEGLTQEWYNRPIYPQDAPIVFSSCVPNNRKLFVDSSGAIGICEKTPDTLRIGTLKDGIEWSKVEDVVETMTSKRMGRCDNCEFIRMCDICPTSIDLSKEEMDIFCHNQKTRLKLQLTLFCELAERGLIYG